MVDQGHQAGQVVLRQQSSHLILISNKSFNPEFIVLDLSHHLRVTWLWFLLLAAILVEPLCCQWVFQCRLVGFGSHVKFVLFSLTLDFQWLLLSYFQLQPLA